MFLLRTNSFSDIAIPAPLCSVSLFYIEILNKRKYDRILYQLHLHRSTSCVISQKISKLNKKKEGKKKKENQAETCFFILSTVSLASTPEVNKSRN